MVGDIIVKKDLSDEILRRLRMLAVAQIRVGLPTRTGGTIHRDTKMTIAEIGAVHEFGADGIPQRSFIRSAMAVHREDVMRHLSGVLQDCLDSRMFVLTQELSRVGAVSTGYVVEQFNISGSPAWAPLSPYTIMRREHGGDRPLWDTGQLVQSVTWEVRLASQ